MAGFMRRVFGANWHTLSTTGNKVYIAALSGTGKQDETDKDLLHALQKLGGNDGDAYKQALAAVSDSGRDDFTVDRARRVLAALVSGAAIEPAREDRVALYREEQKLKSLPPEEGLLELAARSEELKRVLGELDEVRGKLPSPDRAAKRHSYIQECHRKLEAVVGPKSDSTDPLVRSPVAEAVAIAAWHEELGLTD